MKSVLIAAIALLPISVNAQTLYAFSEEGDKCVVGNLEQSEAWYKAANDYLQTVQLLDVGQMIVTKHKKGMMFFLDKTDCEYARRTAWVMGRMIPQAHAGADD